MAIGLQELSSIPKVKQMPLKKITVNKICFNKLITVTKCKWDQPSVKQCLAANVFIIWSYIEKKDEFVVM